ncbi:Uncharacterised protein [Mycobacteroides abscessus subsp. abscessus]|nr:Uncharacterised protein [Mycobacteroides abscessus subsp. abscessus]
MKVMALTAPMIPVQFGTTTRQNVEKGVAPSIRAASSSSVGKLRNAEWNMNVANAENITGMIRPR